MISDRARWCNSQTPDLVAIGNAVALDAALQVGALLFASGTTDLIVRRNQNSLDDGDLDQRRRRVVLFIKDSGRTRFKGQQVSVVRDIMQRAEGGLIHEPTEKDSVSRDNQFDIRIRPLEPSRTEALQFVFQVAYSLARIEPESQLDGSRR